MGGEEYSETYFKLISRASSQKCSARFACRSPPLYLCRMFNNFPSFRGLHRKVLHVLEVLLSFTGGFKKILVFSEANLCTLP